MKTVFQAMAGLALLAAGVAPGAAATLAEPQRPAASFIAEQRPALAPLGHVVMCAKKPHLCAPQMQGEDEIELTRRSAALLDRINRSVNAAVAYRPDELYNGMAERWRVAVDEGDCEDIALAKREALLEAGVPARAMRLAVARTMWGEGHAVLVVRTSRGDLVLDNRHDEIRHWRHTDLIFVKIQSAENPRRWFAI